MGLECKTLLVYSKVINKKSDLEYLMHVQANINTDEYQNPNISLLKYCLQREIF